MGSDTAADRRKRERIFPVVRICHESGRQLPNSGVTNLYTLECAAQLEVRQDGAGLIYTLVLPDAESLKPASSNVSIDDSSLRPTKSVKIWCDVAANAPDGSGQSDAYVASDIKEITFGN